MAADVHEQKEHINTRACVDRVARDAYMCTDTHMHTQTQTHAHAHAYAHAHARAGTRKRKHTHTRSRVRVARDAYLRIFDRHAHKHA